MKMLLLRVLVKGNDALDKMKTFKPDIVLAGIDMQDLTGFELSKKIKNDPTFHSTKVLLLAGDLEGVQYKIYSIVPAPMTTFQNLLNQKIL